LENHRRYSTFLHDFNVLEGKMITNIIWIFILIIFVFYDTIVLFVNSGINENTDASFDSMINGTASKPYVYRMLVPALLRFIDFVSPRFFSEYITRNVLRIYPGFLSQYHINYNFVYDGIWSITIILISLTLYSILLYLGSLKIIFLPRSQAPIASLLGLLMLPPFFDSAYIYDMPQLTLSAACLYFMYQQKWALYFVFFVLLCLNKETSIVLIFAYLYNYFDKHGFKILSKLTATQILTYLTIRILIMVIYVDNPGHVVQVNIDDQIKFIFGKFSYEDFILATFFIFILTYRWFSKPIFLRRSLILVVPLLMLFFVGGSPGEYRVFYETLYVITLLISHSITVAWKI
jgi:hypothetical protein